MTSVDGSSPGPGVRVPPPFVYLAGFLAGLAVERAIPSPRPPGWLRIAAAAGGLSALLALDTTAMSRFVRAGTPMIPFRPATHLVTDGPYRLTRNPMYVGMGCGYAGAAVASGALWALATLPAVLLVIDRQVIQREERHLAETFGGDYERYRQRVRRWL
jgi:protein-S-isoprenylcysteine O-methyltransferase Ste14